MQTIIRTKDDQNDGESVASSNPVDTYSIWQSTLQEAEITLQRKIAQMIRDGYITDDNAIMQTFQVERPNWRMRLCVDLKSQELDSEVVTVNHFTISEDTPR